MNKQTKKNKRTKRKNRTMKYYGGENPVPPTQVPKQVLPPIPPQTQLGRKKDEETLPGIVGNAAISYAGNTFNYLKDKVMDHATKPSTEEKDASNNTNPSIISTAMNVVDKVSGAVVSQVNEVLKSPLLQKGVKDRLEETTKIITDFNEDVSTPEAREELKKAVGNVAVVTDIVLDKMDEPIDKAIDKIGESGQKIASAAVSGAIKVGTDGLGAVPGVGVVVGTLKTASDLAAAASNMSGAVSEGTETLKDLVGNVKDAVNDAEKEVAETTNIATDVNRLGQQQIVGRQIGGRIKKSILEFENPLQNKNKIGGYKTKRKFYKNKRCSTNKRVNFSI
jgi:hypothetical protein